MRLGIDASNIRAGGGLVHLKELLANAEPQRHGFENIIVWGGRATLDELVPRPWLERKWEPACDAGIVRRSAWQTWVLSALASEDCDVLFSPGGTYLGSFRPFVSMIQNWLPFDPGQMAHQLSGHNARLHTLRRSQLITLRTSQAAIYLTNHAWNDLRARFDGIPDEHLIAPHGVSAQFSFDGKPQRSLSDCSLADPFRFFYISTIEKYKNQVNLVHAVGDLRDRGLPVSLDLIGSGRPGYLGAVQDAISQRDPRNEYIFYLGMIPHERVPAYYERADAFVFPSLCETFGMPILEAMSSGLPVACSDLPVMREIAADAACFFPPETPQNIAACLDSLVRDLDRRRFLSHAGVDRATNFSWENTADATLDFIARVAKRYHEAHATPKLAPPVHVDSRDGIDFHEQLARQWEQKYLKSSFSNRLTLFKKCLNSANREPGVWLDAGCGTGTLSRWLASTGSTVLAVDASREMIHVAEVLTRNDLHREKLHFQTIDTIEHLEHADCTLDGVLCSSVLEYTNEPTRCLSEFARVLKPGGLLLVTVPNSRSVIRWTLSGIHRLTGSLGRSWPSYMTHSRHSYSIKQFAEALNANGFIIQSSSVFGTALPGLFQRIRFLGPLILYFAVRQKEAGRDPAKP
jgi:glycosyltransferase involved in cell wall biosynthesis/2-polyprenyl-3-methyl-5-hydroxy-6-metoxy-1,4-benzoquinol methylase